MSASVGVREFTSYCRICTANCGVRVHVGPDGRLVQVRGDHEHPLTQGYACSKGLHAASTHNSPARLLQPLKRVDGGFVPVPLHQALEEIACTLERIIARDGPDAVAAYRGTANYFNATGSAAVQAWLRGLGSKSFFSTMTIDQSAKWVAMERLGRWHAGHQTFDNAQVSLLFGTNPLVSLLGGAGFDVMNPAKRLREARARGLRVIVVDPRRTELARHADLHLQAFPGEDATIAAALLHMIFENGWEDREFCADWANGVEELRRAVAPFDVDYAAARAGVPAAQLRAAAELFAHQSRRGIASAGTGPDMGPHSNLAEHLIESLNVVCGRFRRAGDPVTGQGVLSRPRALHAEALSPRRRWELGPRSRVRGLGMLMGEKMTAALPDEILEPGPGQVRALLVTGGNPASALPDQTKAERALRSLDLLVAIEPFMSTTARLAHYVLPPKLQFERADAPLLADAGGYYGVPFAQYTDAVARPPSDAVVDDWYPFWWLGRRLGRPLRLHGVTFDAPAPPSTDDLLEALLVDSRVPWRDLRECTSGKVLDLPPEYVQPPRSDADGRFETCPPDVVAELAAVRSESRRHGDYPGRGGPYTHLLAVRRVREVINTSLHDLPEARRRHPQNRLHVHPADLDDVGLVDGDPVSIEAEHGEIPALVAADDDQRRGVVSMTHGWGGLPSERLEYADVGANTNLLVSATEHVEAINGMPRFTAIPVRLRRREVAAPERTDAGAATA